MRLILKISFLLMVGFTLLMVLNAQAATTSAVPGYIGTAVIHNSSFDTTVSFPAASTGAGNYQYAFVDYASTGNYSGAPSGWTQVCVAKGAASIAVFVHLNGPSEPASNSWGIGGTVGGIYAIAIGAVANSSGVDGSICNAPSNGAATITAGTPKIGSSGTVTSRRPGLPSAARPVHCCLAGRAILPYGPPERAPPRAITTPGCRWR